MNRIYIYVALAFVASFAGVSWAARGFPVGVGTEKMVLTTPDRGKNAGHGAPGDKGPSLDTIKLEALQAATGFALSPCDSTMKQNLVEAMTAYVRAWQIKLDCPRLANVPMFCGDEKLRAAVTAFSTPLDSRLAVAAAQAFSQPGITIGDFSETIRYDMLRFGGPALRPGISPVCEPRLRTNALRRR